MSSEVKMLIGIGVVCLGIFGVIALISSSNNSSQPVDSAKLVRENSNKIEGSSGVTLVEFGDYQCPACATAHPTVKRLLDKYQGKITFVFRNFPLPLHKNADISSRAAEAAGIQGKYWEMHDLLYENQDKWAESEKPLDIFVGFAQKLDLDGEKFRQDVQSNQFDDKISGDKSDGTALGVNSTPTFFVNGQKIEAPTTYEKLKEKIDSFLAK